MLILDRRYFETAIASGAALSHCIDDYPDGIVILVDKPYRWTSADVIRKIKYTAIRHFAKKNLKVGHAGTLDPLATGVLLLCLGNACKQAQRLQDSDKEYVAGVCFGATTPSYDMEKDIDRHFGVDGISEASIKAALPSFTGEQDQVAPLFSAKMTGGQRAYELARKLHGNGEDGALDEAAKELLRVNRINISEMELLSFGYSSSSSAPATPEGASQRINVTGMPSGLPLAEIRVNCSKGTYIRALARDLGEKMGSGAFLYSLRRSRCGDFNADNGLDVNEVLSLLKD